MTTQQLADRLVHLCRQGLNAQARAELYADTAVSLKPENGTFRPVRGLEAIQAEGAAFLNLVETMHELVVSAPLLGERYFSVAMQMDMTLRGPGRQQVSEICVYQVADGKIVQEQFFF
ncbi:nuclear transport factor 2 family protein [Hymenobacter psoromatis]|uniref:nuclear transport factor 2 family protein n=1 Tax=Hymenobacter psoromatis TaxID=1484116 RepID=UPI001CBEB909|nr:nuclear transport factor 2 family protein [Hymenobacter psoromatis]